MTVIAPALTWTGERFESGRQVTLLADGSIGSVEAAAPAAERLPNVALLPGFVNVHSHAFQRGLRGFGEHFPAGAGSFWTWREKMYALVEEVDHASMRHLAIQAFGEMRDAGITTVGEFHYLHHATPGCDYAFDRVLLDAAAEAGIRIVLLSTYYALGGFGLPLGPAQRRFRSESLAMYWDSIDRVVALLDPAFQSVGAVAHSVRAASIEDIVAIHDEARHRGLVFHIHVEEQRQEIDDCRRAHGLAPMALLNQRMASAEAMTAVHCTHTEPGDMTRYLDRGGRVCLCPLTEGNLGDGIPRLDPWKVLRSSLAFGTDSNLRLGMFEDLRWVEYAQRLRSETRGVLLDDAGRVAPAVFRAATAGGAASLGIRTGQIAAGYAADFMALDLRHPALAGVPPELLLEAAIFGADNGAILGTWVGGRWRPSAVPPRA